MKMSIQEKVADLERRILALEGRPHTAQTTTRVTTTTTSAAPDLEPELSGLWAQFDAVMRKAFRR